MGCGRCKHLYTVFLVGVVFFLLCFLLWEDENGHEMQIAVRIYLDDGLRDVLFQERNKM